MGYSNCKDILVTNLRTLLYSLNPSTYDELAPKVEYWIEYIITERFATPESLGEQLSIVVWHCTNFDAEIPQFLKEFRDAPNRSEQMRSFVDQFCLHALRWFAGASADSFQMNDSSGSVPSGGGNGFVRAASFLGQLINRGLVGGELVRWHIVKPLTLYQTGCPNLDLVIRASAIYRLFTIAGDTLLQGLLEPADVQVCFGIVDAQNPSRYSGVVGFNDARLKELRRIHAAWLQRKEDELKEAKTTPVEDVDTLVAFAPQDLPATHVDIGGPSSASQDAEFSSMLRGVDFQFDTPADAPISTTSSPTLSISTISDLTPTELGEDNVKDSDEPIFARHETFYLGDGNVEIMCGHTIFRIHSPIVSFSSPKLRDMLSQPTLLNAPTPEGCPRIVFDDSAEDFAVLLKMIYTPGFPTWRKVPEFRVFASLLRMTTKYGFSEVREQLLHCLEGAYPTKWEAYQTASVLGEDVFGSPEPHPNAVLNLFLEQNVRFAIPLASYRAALDDFSSLISDEPGTMLSRLTLASTIYGMELMRGGFFKRAYSIAYNLAPKECDDEKCLMKGDVSEGLRKIYAAVVKKGGGDMLSPLSLGGAFCASCSKPVERDYDSWCAWVWKNLPRVFRVGKSWEEV